MGAGYRWRAVVSAQQDGGTKEEYIVLWTDQAGCPEPEHRRGAERRVADGSGGRQLARLVLRLGRLDHFRAEDPGLRRARGRQIHLQRGVRQGREDDDLAGGARPVAGVEGDGHARGQVHQRDFGEAADYADSVAQRQDPAARLLAIDMLRFVSFGDRSPFVVNFLLGSTNEKVTYAVMHAPGSSDPNRFPAASNVFGLSAHPWRAPQPRTPC